MSGSRCQEYLFFFVYVWCVFRLLIYFNFFYTVYFYLQHITLCEIQNEPKYVLLWRMTYCVGDVFLEVQYNSHCSREYCHFFRILFSVFGGKWVLVVVAVSLFYKFGEWNLSFYLYDFLLKNAKQIALIVFCNTLRRTGGLYSIVALLQYPGYSKG